MYKRQLLAIAELYPVPTRSTPSDTFPGTGLLVEAGRDGEVPDDAYALWALNVEGEYELVGLENPGDYRRWATSMTLHLLWDSRSVDDEDPSGRRAMSHLRKASRRWKAVTPLVDSDRDNLPEHGIRTSSLSIGRG